MHSRHNYFINGLKVDARLSDTFFRHRVTGNFRIFLIFTTRGPAAVEKHIKYRCTIITHIFFVFFLFANLAAAGPVGNYHSITRTYPSSSYPNTEINSARHRRRRLPRGHSDSVIPAIRSGRLDFVLVANSSPSSARNSAPVFIPSAILEGTAHGGVCGVL